MAAAASSPSLSPGLLPGLLLAAAVACGAAADGRQDAAAMTEALAAWHAEQYTAARRIMEPLARQGHAEALFRMGIIYERGLGVTPDEEIAEAFYNGYCPLPRETDAAQ